MPVCHSVAWMFQLRAVIMRGKLTIWNVPVRVPSSVLLCLLGTLPDSITSHTSLQMPCSVLGLQRKTTSLQQLTRRRMWTCDLSPHYVLSNTIVQKCSTCLRHVLTLLEYHTTLNNCIVTSSSTSAMHSFICRHCDHTTFTRHRTTLHHTAPSQQAFRC